MLYKIYEDFETSIAVANEKGVIEIANNDRTKDDGTEVEEIKDIDTAIKCLVEEKYLNVDEIDGNYIEFEF